MKKISVFLPLILAAAISGCAPQSEEERKRVAREQTDQTQFASSSASTRIVARSRADMNTAVSAVKNLTSETLMSRRGLRMIELSEIPWLRASPEGAAYIAGVGPKALARGEPLSACPAAASETGAASRADAARGAIAACFALLEARGAAPDCGCRLSVLDNHLIDRRESFAFAPAVSARLSGPGGRQSLLVADALPPEDGVERIVLRDAAGPVAYLSMESSVASLIFLDAPERIFAGARTFFGYRRGRTAERLVLANEGGEEIRLLIGVEQRDASRQ